MGKFFCYGFVNPSNRSVLFPIFASLSKAVVGSPPIADRRLQPFQRIAVDRSAVPGVTVGQLWFVRGRDAFVQDLQGGIDLLFFRLC